MPSQADAADPAYRRDRLHPRPADATDRIVDRPTVRRFRLVAHHRAHDLAMILCGPKLPGARHGRESSPSPNPFFPDVVTRSERDRSRRGETTQTALEVGS